MTAAFAVTALLAAGLAAVMVNLAFQNRFSRYVNDEQAQRVTQLVRATGETYRRSGGWNPQALDALSIPAAMTGATLQIRDRTGRVVYTGGGGSPDAMAMHGQMMGAAPLGPPRDLPVVVNGQTVGTAVVAVPKSGLPAGEQAFRASLNTRLVLAGLSAGTVALLVGAGFARRLTRPVRELTAAAADVAAGRRSRRARVRRGDEFGDLADAFNDMAGSVEREDTLRRSFIAAVAHELRTPLTIMRGEIEAAQDGLRPSTGALLGSLHDESDRLGRLIADLETLAAADAAAFSVRRDPVDLAAVTEHAVAALRGRFEEASVTVTTRLNPVTVSGDSQRLAQIATNLLTNAAKFGGPGGAVTVTVARAEDTAILTVADTGPGIPADELDKVFDRFFRGRNARANGSGIGLAVVAELVAAHDGSVRVTSPPGQGAGFRVELPLTRSPKPYLASAAPSAHVGTLTCTPATDNADRRLVLRHIKDPGPSRRRRTSVPPSPVAPPRPSSRKGLP